MQEVLTSIILKESEEEVIVVEGCGDGISEAVTKTKTASNQDRIRAIQLLARMQELGLKEEDYGFYLDLRKYGSTRHAGFGLGFERCVMYLTGMGNIRDVIPFPRTVNNCEL